MCKMLEAHDLHSAPFSKLGQDCFRDVNHKKLSWDLRKLALSMAKYLEDRMMTGSTDSEMLLYRTDALFTQMITLMTHMHRAMMRNWHQMLMVISNFAYVEDTADEDLMTEGTKVIFKYKGFYLGFRQSS